MKNTCLNKKEFDILLFIKSNEDNKISQRKISTETGFSLGTVNKLITELTEKEYITSDLKITEVGLKALEPYKVQRAIFLAAGFGSRLVPITLNTPKPLIKVHGKKIIETLLDAVVKANIPEIIIVRGYLGEQFEVLLHKYPNIKFIDNPKYNEANNISSAYMVKDYFERAYVLESDLLLSNEKLIREYEYSSHFLGIPVDETDDWCVETKNGIITKEKVGGVNCHLLLGISYYDEEYGKKLAKDMEEVFNSPGGKEKYWEQVQLDVRKENYKFLIRECKREDIVEIDTFNELKQIDKAYDQ